MEYGVSTKPVDKSEPGPSSCWRLVMMVERSHFHQNAPPFLLLMLMFLQLITATLKLRSRKDRVRWRAWLVEGVAGGDKAVKVPVTASS